jgi:BolA protein
MNRKQRITEKLTVGLQPSALNVRDISHLHAGHAGAGIETHFTVTVTSAQFAGLTRVQQHQMVNRLLADEFTGGLHALSLSTHTE